MNECHLYCLLCTQYCNLGIMQIKHLVQQLTFSFMDPCTSVGLLRMRLPELPIDAMMLMTTKEIGMITVTEDKIRIPVTFDLHISLLRYVSTMPVAISLACNDHSYVK